MIEIIYIKQYLYHQSKHSRNIEIQNITLFSSNLPLMQREPAPSLHSWVSDKNLWLGIETQRVFPKVIDWLTCCHEQTQNTITHNQQNHFFKISYPRKVHAFQILGQWPHIYFILSNCSNRFAASTKVLSKKNWAVSLRINSKSSQGTPTKQTLVVISWKSKIEGKKKRCGIRKILQFFEVFTASVIGHFSWNGVKQSFPRFCVQRKKDNAINYKTRSSSITSSTKFNV